MVRTLFVSLMAMLAHAATHEIYPETHSRVFSAYKQPVGRVHSGDTVITRTWDSGGGDWEGVKHIQHPYVYPESGNPLMGPFFIEEADFGDTLQVHLDKVRCNRNYGYTSYRVSPGILNAGAAETLYKNFYEMNAVRNGRGDLIPWDIDLRRLIAVPRLKEGARSGLKIEVPLRPMIGCIGVASPGEKVETSGPSGSWGGNMDYNDVAEGATLYFPVYHKGAFFYVGDGHAVQGDGEGLGTGIETSLDVQFTVKVLKGKRTSIPRLENDQFVVSIGSQPEFSSDMANGLRMANSDMIDWLTTDYKLTHPEAHMLMGSVVQHKIVTYFGTVATLIPKQYLKRK